MLKIGPPGNKLNFPSAASALWPPSPLMQCWNEAFADQAGISTLHKGGGGETPPHEGKLSLLPGWLKALFFNVAVETPQTLKLKAWSWKLEAGSLKLQELALLCFSLVFCRDRRDICRGTLHFTVETVGTKALKEYYLNTFKIFVSLQSLQ